MKNGFELLTMSNTHEDLMKYRENGAIRGKYLGFPQLHQHYSMSLPGCTDFTGFPACFTKDQLVITNRGDIPISEIKKGDFVLSYNHEIGINEMKMVINTPIHKTKEKILKIKMKDGTIIKCTENHLFWNGSEYVKIKELLLLTDKK